MVNRLPRVSWRDSLECLRQVWVPCYRALRSWVLLLSGKHLIWTTQKLVVSELIFIQKRTNYPEGWLIYRLYQDFGAKDRFTVVNAAALGKQKL